MELNLWNHGSYHVRLKRLFPFWFALLNIQSKWFLSHGPAPPPIPNVQWTEKATNKGCLLSTVWDTPQNLTRLKTFYQNYWPTVVEFAAGFPKQATELVCMIYSFGANVALEVHWWRFSVNQVMVYLSTTQRHLDSLEFLEDYTRFDPKNPFWWEMKHLLETRAGPVACV